MDKMIKAIIFDMDGVLIDSEGVWNAARKAIFEDFGEPWTEEDHHNVMGVSTQEWVDYMRSRLDQRISQDDLIARVLDYMADHYEQQIPFLPGAVQAVELACRHYPTGLATGSHPRLLEIIIRDERLRGKFKAVVSADEVENGKPAPDVYFEAARRMGCQPRNCACLEDSGNGIKSGAAAGMKVIAVPDERFMPPPEDLQKADLVLDSLKAFSLDVIADLEG